MRGYYKIDVKLEAEGLYELWENRRYGDEVAEVLSLNGIHGIYEYYKIIRRKEVK